MCAFSFKNSNIFPKTDFFFFKLRAKEYFMPFLMEEFCLIHTASFCWKVVKFVLLGALAPNVVRASRSLRVEKSSDLTSLLAHLLQ